MTLEIRPLRSDDEVLRAHRLELKCYPVELAATLEAFLYRWRAFPDLFLGAWEDGELIGLACGVRTDASDCSDVGIKKTHGGAGDGSKLCVLSVAVDPSRRRRGVGARLLRTLLGEARRIGLRVVRMGRDVYRGAYRVVQACHGKDFVGFISEREATEEKQAEDARTADGGPAANGRAPTVPAEEHANAEVTSRARTDLASSDAWGS